jgi:hypothetical protein
MVMRKKRSDKVMNSSIDNFIKSSPDEHRDNVEPEMLDRVSRTFRVNDELWIDFDAWCKRRKTSRSDEIEKFILDKMEKSKSEYFMKS